MHPILIKGSSALSDFRLKNLKDALLKEVPHHGTISITAHSIYIINASEAIDSSTQEQIHNLLGAESPFEETQGFFVTPRKATISPWSSKATDIFLNCGIQSVMRVERGIHFILKNSKGKYLQPNDLKESLIHLYDPMTEGVYLSLEDFFECPKPSSFKTIPLLEEGRKALEIANIEQGLAMSDDEIQYLFDAYTKIKRNPSDVELVMFSQVNSEHCRHKIFNADWIVDGTRSEHSLFQMIKNTYKKNPEDVCTAYSDNSGVLLGKDGDWWQVSSDASKQYTKSKTRLDLLCKVETHNHPTAISPYPGAATGVGGEIRDEGATGIGGRSKAGLSAFMVSHLNIDSLRQPWELEDQEHPKRLATPLQIMLEGPIGGASFGNEFGRPQLTGLFRTFELIHNDAYRGYHKPIMAAGGMGNLKKEHVQKNPIPSGSLIIQIGGPAMKIGLGGGAASSIGAGSQSEALDFDSVQRDNPEMQRRCQQVIDACIALENENPILSIHDIGAGGLSNGLPELVEETGGRFELRAIHNQDLSMSPMEIWCNEAQERYVLAISPKDESLFQSICVRERCPFAIVGTATSDHKLSLVDDHFKNQPIDIEMDILLGKTPKMLRDCSRNIPIGNAIDFQSIQLDDAIERVLKFPAVANKSFLITIADRTITGTVCRDQMVGPWQTPVADVAVTSTTMESYTGEAMAIGERTPLAILDAPASGRMAIGECLTNIAASLIGSIRSVKLSANWMVAAGEDGEDANLYDTVQAVGMELCPQLGICIPVGKDSMSMRTTWSDSNERTIKQVSPLSLLVTGFSTVEDVRKTLTPNLKENDSVLILLDLGMGKNRLGGSTLAQCYKQFGNTVPNLDDPKRFIQFFDCIQKLNSEALVLSYHDRSDGGLLASVFEMSIAGRKGVTINLEILDSNHQEACSIFEFLFNEELGAVIEISKEKVETVTSYIEQFGLTNCCHVIGHANQGTDFKILKADTTLYQNSIFELNKMWSELTHTMQKMRDNPVCAEEAYRLQSDENDLGIQIKTSFDPDSTPNVTKGVQPKIAIFREQGINGQNEMAFAFHKAGFDSIDVHMTDLIEGRFQLDAFQALVACGGFSYGDVLGAGSGWAKSILYNQTIRNQFETFFANPDTLALGVCNGCQMLSQLKSIIPGAEHWPYFTRNLSEQFEGRLSNVSILKSNSLILNGMEGSTLPIPVAHGEGRADFTQTGNLEECEQESLIGMRYVNSTGTPSEIYPINPNGSKDGNTCFTSKGGRVTIMMPHPERCFRAVQLSYGADYFKGENGPWMRLFENARSNFS